MNADVDAAVLLATGNMQRNSYSETEKVNKKNILNIVFFLLNAIIINVVGSLGIFGLPTNTELSEKYQTIITPKGTAFSIWGIIYIFQAIWSIFQLLPNYRMHPYVQQGVSYWYVAVCTAQIAWTFAFAFEVIWLSLVMMLLILTSLLGCVISNYYQYRESDKTVAEFWMFLFPFEIHCGWIICASALNVNVLLVAAGFDDVVQLTAGVSSLAVLHAVALWALYVPTRPNYTIACVVAWANYWISQELKNPIELITETFDATVIVSIQYAALVVTNIVMVLIVSRVMVGILQRHVFQYGGSVSSDGEEALQYQRA